VEEEVKGESSKGKASISADQVVEDDRFEEDSEGVDQPLNRSCCGDVLFVNVEPLCLVWVEVGKEGLALVVLWYVVWLSR